MGTDLVVLGAGPAGAAISLLMADRGYSVEILDAAFFPRTKICGEFLNPQAVEWLRQNDILPFVESLQPYPIHGMKITNHKKDVLKGSYSVGNGYAVQRKDFDTLLVSFLKQRGIRLLEGFRATELILEGDRVAGVRGQDADGASMEKRAQIVIGADGRNNLIGRTFGWMQFIPNLRKYAYLTYFDDVSDLENYGEIHLVENGYIGVAPLTEKLANVILVIDESARPADGTDLKTFLMSYVEKTDLAERIKNREPIVPIMSGGPLAFTMKHVTTSGAILIGDTCGFIDPFTGEGINYAFLSASIAAEVLDKCFKSNRFDQSELMIYDERRERILGRKYQLSRLLQKAVHSPRFSDFLVRKFAGNQTIADTMVSAVGGAIPVERVWNLRFILQALFGFSSLNGSIQQ